MFYKSKKVLINLIFSSIFLVFGLSLIAVGLLCKFVFLTNNINLADLLVLILPIVGAVSLFISFILGIVNQRHLQYVNNNLLEENKKQWQEQINKEINDPNSDFVLADEKTEEPEVQEDEVININIIDDKKIENTPITNETTLELINNDIENTNTNSVEQKTPIVSSEYIENDDVIIEVHKTEEIIDKSELNNISNLSNINSIGIPPIRPMNIPSRTIPNNQQENIVNNPSTTNNYNQTNQQPIGNNYAPQTNVYNQQNSIPTRPIPQRNIPTPTINANQGSIPPRPIPSGNTLNQSINTNPSSIPPRPIPQGNTLNQTINSNQQNTSQNTNPIPPRSIPQRPISIPPKM